MRYIIDDLGTPAYGDCWMTFKHGRNPLTGAEVVLGSLARGGMVIIDPKARSSVQIRTDKPFADAWGIAQAPNGDVYQADYGRPFFKLCVWDWKSPHSRIVAEPDLISIFTIDVAPDGKVYLPEYSTNTMYFYDPATGKVGDCGNYNEFNPHIRNVYCGPDGIVYVTSISYQTGTHIIALEPKSGKKWRVEPPVDERRDAALQITKDGKGRVLVGTQRWGRTFWHELVAGKPRPIAQEEILLSVSGSSMAFSDRGYVQSIVGHDAIYIDPQGAKSTFRVEYEDSPLRIFSVEAGEGRVWGGTFIPLTLFNMDPATGKATMYGNPTPVGGEIYNMAFSRGKLYMASYPESPITRFDPAKPYRKDQSIHANPAQLGLMKEDGLPLHRPHGKAMDPLGRVFFASLGGYGCMDSGICRIDPETDEITRWIYPSTTFDAMTYVGRIGQLLVSEKREGENALRFTFVSPENGEILWSEPVIQDKGEIRSWLDGGGDLVYGLHAYRATLFAFSLSQRKIVASLPELRFGEHCCNVLWWGEDGRVCGLTDTAIFAADKELKGAEKLADYSAFGKTTSNRYGASRGPDGAVYFANGTHLMRMRAEK